MKVITICGSMKYKDNMIEIVESLALRGYCVISPVYLNKSKELYTNEDFKTLKDIHFQKIKLSDAILIVNIDNYIGDSTKLEIDYAKELNKEILYYTDMINELLGSYGKKN